MVPETRIRRTNQLIALWLNQHYPELHTLATIWATESLELLSHKQVDRKSPETRAKISQRMIGHVVSEETRAKIAAYWEARRKDTPRKEHKKRVRKEPLPAKPVFVSKSQQKRFAAQKLQDGCRAAEIQARYGNTSNDRKAAQVACGCPLCSKEKT